MKRPTSGRPALLFRLRFLRPGFKAVRLCLEHQRDRAFAGRRTSRRIRSSPARLRLWPKQGRGRGSRPVVPAASPGRSFGRPTSLAPGRRAVQLHFADREENQAADGDRRPRTSIAAVWDVVRALLLLADHPAAVGRTYFVTSGRPYAWREITMRSRPSWACGASIFRCLISAQKAVGAVSELAARIRGREPLLDPGSGRRRLEILLDLRRFPHPKRAGRFVPEYDLAGAIRRTVAWYAERGLARIR